MEVDRSATKEKSIKFSKISNEISSEQALVTHSNASDHL